MSRNRSLERRAREEVECIKAQEAADEERKQARMRELAEQAREHREAEAADEERRKEERDAKLRRSQDEKAKGEERRARDSARRSRTCYLGYFKRVGAKASVKRERGIGNAYSP